MLSVVRFDPDGPARAFPTLEASGWSAGQGSAVWVDLEEPTPAELELLADPFRFHPLAIEDCLTPEHQPKVELFGDVTFVIVRGIDFNPPVAEFQTLKLAAFLGPDYLVTYHRRPMRSVRTVHDKLAAETGPAFRGPDYLLYEILDHLVEFYFPILDGVEEDIDAIDADLFSNGTPEVLDRIHASRRHVQEVKRALAPHREVFGRLARGETHGVTAATTPFYRDLYDSTLRLVELADSYRDLLASSFDAYLSIVSQRLNEVMKVLTIFATIMLPLTFIAGVYGMNFETMPELGWRYGYPIVWGIMIAIAGGLLWFFHRRGWL